MKLTSQAEGADPVLTRAIQEDKIPWYKKRNLRYLYFFLFPTCMGIEMTSGWDSQMINSVQIVDPWQEYFNYPTGAISGILAAIYSLGAICSIPFIPVVTKALGRRWSIFAGSCVMCVGAIIQGCSVHIAMYLVARWILGFGIPICIVAASSLIGELGYPKERAVLTSLFNTSYFPGAILAAGITFGTQQIPNDWAWRIPSLLQIVPSLFQISLVLFLPESPRWLISKDRREEAYEILVKYHAEGDRDSVLVAAEFAQIETTIKLELENSKQSWWDFFKKAGMRKRMLIAMLLGLFTQWSGNTLISYYLSTILDMIGYTDPNFQGKLNVSKSCWELVNASIAALLVKRFARRKMYLICTCSLLCVYVGWTISMERVMTTGSLAAGKLVIFWIFIYSPCYNIGYNALTYTYLVELFPYAARSHGISFFQFFGRGANFFSTFVNPIGMANIEWRYLIVFCVWLAFEILCVYFLWPETHGRTLEELAFLFEGDELKDRQVIATEKQLIGGESNSVNEKSAVETVETKA